MIVGVHRLGFIHRPGSGGGGPTIQISASKSSSNIDIVDDGLTAKGTSSVNWSAARVDTGRTTGKWYWEVTYKKQTGNRVSAGITTLSSPDDGFFNPEEATTNSNNGDNWGDWGDGNSFAYGEDAVIMHALDLDNGKHWFGLNGTWYDNDGTQSATTDPTTLTPHGTFSETDEIYPTVRINQSNEEMAFELGEGTFQYSVPSGFTNYANV